MQSQIVSSIPLQNFSLWKKLEGKRIPVAFNMEITARCNNNCRHCYTNLPAGDALAREKEFSAAEIGAIADEAASLGSIWCLVTGGEPLLREDFPDIYLSLVQKGLLVSVFTNGALITPDHVKLFKKHPPHDIEISVYGATREIYENVTRKRGSFNAFSRGLQLLLDNGIRVRLKAMALRSNLGEMPEIARFCRRHTKDFFRFDPFLHMSYHGDPERNLEIQSERLSSEEIITLEQSDPRRLRCLEKTCGQSVFNAPKENGRGDLFRCGIGVHSFSLGADGFFRPCASMRAPNCVYDLRRGSLTDAWCNFTPGIKAMRSDRSEFLKKCGSCPIVALCMWCPAHAWLETGELDAPAPYFCETAFARAEAMRSRLVGAR